MSKILKNPIDIFLYLMVIVSLLFRAPSVEKIYYYQMYMLTRGFQGKIGVAIKNLNTNKTYYFNENDRFPTASVIKLPVLTEVYYQSSERKINLNEKIALQSDQMVTGSGILRQLNPSIPLTLRDLTRLMIIVSDCSAYNNILDLVGSENVNRRMKQLGLTNTKVLGKIEYTKDTESSEIDSIQDNGKKVDAEGEYGIGHTTPKDMMILLEKIAKGEIVDTYTSQTIEEILSSNMYDDRIPRLLPPGTEVAHKTGTTALVRNDAGYIKTPNGTYIIIVLTNNIKDLKSTHENDAVITIATISQITYNYFSLH